MTGASPRDEVIPDDKWEFDAEVTRVFDDMLQRSIPGYDLMRQLTSELAHRYAQDGTYIVDLGCSRGAALEPILSKRGARNRYLGVEVSEPMRAAAEERFASWSEWVTIRDLDLRDDYPKVPASVVLCVLTLQFTPIEYRQRILSDVYRHLQPGGALLLVEKVIGSDLHVDEQLTGVYYDQKGDNGYTAQQIQAKRRSLEGVLVPITAEWNEMLLRKAGFDHIECYWRHLQFAGWVAVKDAA